MKTYLLSFLLLIILSFAPNAGLHAQCGILDTAFSVLTMRASVGGTNNRSGMAYNPGARLYYAVNAGSPDYPANTYNDAGVLLDSTI